MNYDFSAKKQNRSISNEAKQNNFYPKNDNFNQSKNMNAFNQKEINLNRSYPNRTNIADDFYNKQKLITKDFYFKNLKEPNLSQSLSEENNNLSNRTGITPFSSVPNQKRNTEIIPSATQANSFWEMRSKLYNQKLLEEAYEKDIQMEEDIENNHETKKILENNLSSKIRENKSNSIIEIPTKKTSKILGKDDEIITNDKGYKNPSITQDNKNNKKNKENIFPNKNKLQKYTNSIGKYDEWYENEFYSGDNKNNDEDYIPEDEEEDEYNEEISDFSEEISRNAKKASGPRKKNNLNIYIEKGNIKLNRAGKY